MKRKHKLMVRLRSPFMGWAIYLVVTTWLLVAHVPARSAIDAVTVEFDWTTIDTPQTYDGFSDDGTFYYTLTVNPDLSSNYDVLMSDGTYLHEGWQAAVDNGSVKTQNGSSTDSLGNQTSLVRSIDSASGDVSHSATNDLANPVPHSSSMVSRGDGSFSSNESWGDGSAVLSQSDPPAADGSVTVHYRVSNATGIVYQSDRTVFVDGSYSEVTASDGLKFESTGNADGSGSIIAKDANGNIVGAMTWGSDGAAISASGIYAP